MKRFIIKIISRKLLLKNNLLRNYKINFEMFVRQKDFKLSHFVFAQTLQTNFLKQSRKSLQKKIQNFAETNSLKQTFLVTGGSGMGTGRLGTDNEQTRSVEQHGPSAGSNRVYVQL